MKNLAKLVGIIAFVAVIGFSMTACDDGNDDGDNTDPKTLRITMPTTIFSQAYWNGFMVGVFPAGTTLQQAFDMTGLIAGCDDETSGVDFYESGLNYIVTLPLYNINTGYRWTGSGTFDIYALLGDSDYYKAGSVNISSATTSLTINASNAVQF
jgi:riboflavin transporter FmnP